MKKLSFKKILLIFILCVVAVSLVRVGTLTLKREPEPKTEGGRRVTPITNGGNYDTHGEYDVENWR